MANGADKDFAQVIKESYDPDLGAIKVNVVSNLIPTSYDSIQLSYTGDDLTEVVYKKDGLTVATLDLTYMAGKLVQVDRS
jgi:hypothetical protein